MSKIFTLSFAVALSVTFVFSLSGCGKTDPDTATAAVEPQHDEHDHEEGDEHAGHEHGEWWCAEHGVPEDECTRCDSGLVAAYKDKDDWCEEHSLPDSQCFVCHPELEEKFAARFVAKYGKNPPKPTE